MRPSKSTSAAIPTPIAATSGAAVRSAATTSSSVADSMSHPWGVVRCSSWTTVPSPATTAPRTFVPPMSMPMVGLTDDQLRDVDVADARGPLRTRRGALGLPLQCLLGGAQHGLEREHELARRGDQVQRRLRMRFAHHLPQEADRAVRAINGRRDLFFPAHA